MRLFFQNPSPYLCIILSSLPIIFLIWLLYRYTVNIPEQDQWVITALLDNYYSGKLSFSDLWQQHTDHRLFFPKLIMLALGLLTGYNVLFENAIGLLLGVLTYLLIVRHINNNKNNLDHGLHYRWLWVLLSCLVFSLYQYFNWFNGFQIQWFLNQLALTAGAFLLSNSKTTPTTFFLMCLCGLVASFSGINGLWYWIILAVLLIVKRWRCHERGGYVYGVVSLLVCALVIAVYLTDFHKSNPQHDLLYGLKHPVEFIQYILVLAGNLFARSKQVVPLDSAPLRAALFGGTGVVIFLFLGVYNTFKRPSPEVKPQLFFLFIGLYVLLSAATIAAGRITFGVSQALASRYATLSVLLWVSVLYMLVSFRTTEITKSTALIRVMNHVRIALLFIIFIAVLNGSLNALSSIKRDYGTKECARIAVLYNACPDCLGQIYPDRTWLDEYAIPALKKWSLSVYKNPAPPPHIEKVSRENWTTKGGWTLNGTDEAVMPPATSDYYWGSFSETGANTGAIESDPIQISPGLIVLIPFTLGKGETGQRIGVRIQGDDAIEMVCYTHFPVHKWGCCSFDLSAFKGRSFKIFAQDAAPGKDDWTGLAQPVLIRRPK